MKQNIVFGVVATFLLSIIIGVVQVAAIRNRVIALPTPQRQSLPESGQVSTWGVPSAGLHDLPVGVTSKITQIAVGSHHAIALTTTGTVIGWGTNLKGELTIPTTLTDVVQVSVGISHSVALKGNGVVVLWGDAASNTITPATTVPNDVVQIAAGDRHTVLLRANGTVVVTGVASQRTIPGALTGKTIVAVAAGNDSTLVLDSTGTLYQWGGPAIPTLVSSDVTAVFARGMMYGAVRSNGDLIVWGDRATDLTPVAPATSIDNTTTGCPCVRFPNMSGVQDLAVAEWGIALEQRSGLVLAMPFGGSSAPIDTPARATQLGMHPSHSTGLVLQAIITPPVQATNTQIPQLSIRLPQEFNTIGKVSVWGGRSAIRSIPSNAQNTVIQVAAGSGHIVALRSDSVVVAWGDNDAGQRTVPGSLTVVRQLTDPFRVVAVAAGANFSLALRANGTVIAWGDNTYGQSSVPPSLTDVVQISAGMRHVLALRKNGSIVGWGDNTFGQITIPPLLGVAKINAGGWHSLALLFNNTAVAWGRNDSGQTTLPVLTNVVDIAANNSDTVELLANGNVIVTGDASFGQNSSPTALFQRIGTGNYHILGANSNGQVVGWGLNADGQTTAPSTLLNPFMVVGGGDFSVALAADIVSVPTITATASATPYGNIPLVPTYRALTAYAGYSAWGLGAIPALTDSDISSVAVASDTIAIVHSNNTMTLNESGSTTTLPGSVIANVQAVGIGNGFGAVLKRDHSVSFWGSPPTIPLVFNRNINELSVNGPHMMVLNAAGEVWSNQFQTRMLGAIRHIAAGPNYGVAIAEDGNPSVWAANNDEGLQTIPLSATSLVEVASGTYHILALRADGRVVAWGAGSHDVGQADVPYRALSNVVAIAAGDQFSIALREDGTLVAWGDVPAGTTNQITNLSTDRNVVSLTAGSGIVVAFKKGAAVVGTATRIPSSTPVRIPSITPPAFDNNLLTNQLGWYRMGDTALTLQYVGMAGPYLCTAPSACPQSDPNGVRQRAARFTAVNGDELTSTGKLTLSGTSFTVSYWMRRDRINTNDVALSLGTPAKRTFLSMGFDIENRVYCGFYGDDLRSTTWYTDNDWHHYACTFDKTTLIRQLYRDGVLITQDVSGGAFTAPASSLVIGRRNDNASGLVGSLDDVVIHNVALTASQLVTYTNLPTNGRIADISFADITLQSNAPNRTRFGCIATMPCPNVVIESHDAQALLFTGSEQMQSSDTPLLTNGFTVAYWAKRTATGRNTIVMHGTTPAKRFSTGFNSDNTAYCSIGATTKTSGVMDTNWHFYVCVFDKNTGKLGMSVDAQALQFVTVTYSDSGSILIGRAPEANTGFRGYIDDLVIYGLPLSQATLGQLYNSTNPVSPVLTVTPDMTLTVTKSPTFTPTPVLTALPSAFKTKTALPATIPPVVLYNTNTSTPSSTSTHTITSTSSKTFTITRTPTRTLTLTITQTPTASKSPTITPTPTITLTFTMTNAPSATPNNGTPYTPTDTSTPFMLTRTVLARQSPTFFAQTRTATWFALRASQTSLVLTTTAIPTATYRARLTQTAAVIQTLTAYPLPFTPTRSFTPYPSPKSAKVYALLWPDIAHLYHR